MEITINKLVRSRRKSISLVIEKDSTLTVRAPMRVPQKEIFKLIEEKKKWITEKQQIAQKRITEIRTKQFHEGEMFQFLGKPYPLHFSEEQNEPVIFDGSKFVLHEDYKNFARDALTYCYKNQAYKIISERIDFITTFTGLQYREIGISNAKRTWGSCNSKGNLNFSWRLVLAPIEIIDYVIVHELVHLEELNHSKKFWNKVGLMLPDYKKRRKWLKDNGHLLEF